MAKPVETDLKLLTSKNRGQPNLEASLVAVLQPLIDTQIVVESIPAAFDLDTAIGVQLDVVGIWVGRNRNIPVPIPNPFFALDDDLRGFDEGYWDGSTPSGSTLTSLDDETFRRLLKAKIAYNNNDGSIDALQAVLDAYFTDPATHVFLQDETQANASGAADMRMSVIVTGKWPTIVDLEILQQSLLPIKPAGVRLTYAVASENGGRLFGFDMDNAYVGGWDDGSIGTSPDYIVTNLS